MCRSDEDLDVGPKVATEQKCECVVQDCIINTFIDNISMWRYELDSFGSE